MIRDFSFAVPQTIQFGMGSLKKLPEILQANQSTHVFLVSDPGIAQIGLVKKVQDILSAAQVDCHTYLEVTPNPDIEIVENAAKAFVESGCTSIIALGGGAPMDTGKAIGILARYGGNATDYEGLSKVPGPIVPLIAIPTTAGTGSEVSASTVVTDPERNFKFSIIDHNILPKYALLDPELIMTAPASVAAACGLDALIHAMSHPVSAYFHVAHGVANAILMPAVMEFNALADKGRYETIYNFIREEKDPAGNFRPQMLVDALKKLNHDLNIPSHLQEVGVTEDKFEAMAEDAMKAPNTLANPRQTTVRDFISLYGKAF